MPIKYTTVRRNLITGMNSTNNPILIGNTEVKSLINADLVQIGKTAKRDGFAKSGNAPTALQFKGLTRFNPSGGTDTILGIEGINLRKWTGTGNWSASLDAGFTTGLYTKMIVGNDLAMILNGTDNAHSIDYDDVVVDLADAATSPPKGVVGAYFKDRWFIAKDGLVYFSDVGTQTFDRTENYFRVSVGDNDDITNLVPFKENELFIFKENSVWLLYTENNATPLTQWDLIPVDTTTGCVSKEGAVKVGDDIFFMSNDGVRSIKRNEQDKSYSVQVPISDPIRATWIEEINWTYKGLIRATHYNNRVFFSIPYGTNTTCSHLFVYFLNKDSTLNGWSVWTTEHATAWISGFVKFPKDNETKLYIADSSVAQIYEMFSGDDDDDSGIEFEEIGRIEDLTDQKLEANKKYGKSLFLKTGADEESEVEVYVQVDEEGFVYLGDMNMNVDAITLPVDLPFYFDNRDVSLGNFSLDELEHWYNIQYRLTQSADDSKPLSIIERLFVIGIENFETDGGTGGT